MRVGRTEGEQREVIILCQADIVGMLTMGHALCDVLRKAVLQIRATHRTSA